MILANICSWSAPPQQRRTNDDENEPVNQDKFEVEKVANLDSPTQPQHRLWSLCARIRIFVERLLACPRHDRQFSLRLPYHVVLNELCIFLSHPGSTAIDAWSTPVQSNKRSWVAAGKNVPQQKVQMSFIFAGPLFSSFGGHFFVHFWVKKVAPPSLCWSQKRLVGATNFSVFGVTFLAAKSEKSIDKTTISRIQDYDHLNFRIPLTCNFSAVRKSSCYGLLCATPMRISWEADPWQVTRRLQLGITKSKKSSVHTSLCAKSIRKLSCSSFDELTIWPPQTLRQQPTKFVADLLTARCPPVHQILRSDPIRRLLLAKKT
jgi:hypothetical protein